MTHGTLAGQAAGKCLLRRSDALELEACKLLESRGASRTASAAVGASWISGMFRHTKPPAHDERRMLHLASLWRSGLVAVVRSRAAVAPHFRDEARRRACGRMSLIHGASISSHTASAQGMRTASSNKRSSFRLPRRMLSCALPSSPKPSGTRTVYTQGREASPTPAFCDGYRLAGTRRRATNAGERFVHSFRCDASMWETSAVTNDLIKPVNLQGFLKTVKSIDNCWRTVVKLPHEASP
jgi:hypothetical protein